MTKRLRPSQDLHGTRQPRYLAVGHITLDLADTSATDGTVGGTVLFATATAAALGWRAGLATSSPVNASAQAILHKAEVSIYSFPSRGCATSSTPDHEPRTIFAHRYRADGSRHQTLLSRAPALPAAAIPEAWHEVDILHVAPVLDEVSAASVADVSAGFVGLTAQGFMREATIGRPVRPRIPAVPEALLERAQGIVVSTEDIAAAPDWPHRVTRPGRWVAVTDGPRGAILFIDGRRIHQPAFRAQSIDPTGAGDIFAAALFMQMAGGSLPEQALRFAAAAGAWSVGFRADDPRVAPSLDAVHEVLSRAESGPAQEG